MFRKRFDRRAGCRIDRRNPALARAVGKLPAIGRPGQFHDKPRLGPECDKRLPALCGWRPGGGQRIDTQEFSCGDRQPGWADGSEPDRVDRPLQSVHHRDLIERGIPGQQLAAVAARDQHP